MIRLDCQQGSREWIEARLGIPTASEFKRILTPGGKLAKPRSEYVWELVAEWALGEPVTKFGGNDWTERGQVLEPEARKFYSFQRDLKPRTVGLIYRDEDRMCGCSPDGLVGDNGLIELKCPMAGNHLQYLVGDSVPSKYAMQVQGQLWVSGRAWCDFVSYYPGLPVFIKRVEPDSKIQTVLDEIMPHFVAEVLAGRERMRSLGVVPAAEVEATEEADPSDADLWLTEDDVAEFLHPEGEPQPAVAIAEQAEDLWDGN